MQRGAGSRKRGRRVFKSLCTCFVQLGVSGAAGEVWRKNTTRRDSSIFTFSRPAQPPVPEAS